MKKILLTTFVFAFWCSPATSQVNKEAADDLILTQTDSDFLSCLIFREDDRQVNLDISKTGLTTLVYDLKTKSGDAVYYRLGGLTSCIIELNFDVDGEIVDPPPFYELIKIKSIYTCSTIEKSSAIKSALTYFEKKKIRPVSCLLIYDFDNQCIYWEITSKTGHRDITEQTVVINAVTGEYVRTNEFRYAKR